MYKRPFSEGTTFRLPFTTSKTEPPRVELVTKWVEATTDGQSDQMENQVSIFTNILLAAFMCTYPKSTERY